MARVARPAAGLALALLLACAGVDAAAEPAGAHGLGGLKPTNYDSRVLRVAPAVAGIRVADVDLGTRLELTNDTTRDAIVLGYDGEPYLRVGPRGVFENTHSPATYLNRTTTLPTGPLPPQADASAAPEWRRISSSRTARWHDHRVHYMGSTEPPVVRRDPDHRHTVQRWVVEVRHGNRTIRASGIVTWVPPPSPWPTVVVVLVLAAVVFALSRVWRGTLGAALAVLTATELTHVFGGWDATTASAATKLVQSAYSIGGILLALGALVWLARRGVDAATPAVLVAAIFLFVAGGLADIPTLGHSQLPSTLPSSTARLLVATTLGLGAGLVAATALRLRASVPPPTTRTRERPRQPVTS